MLATAPQHARLRNKGSGKRAPELSGHFLANINENYKFRFELDDTEEVVHFNSITDKQKWANDHLFSGSIDSIVDQTVDTAAVGVAVVHRKCTGTSRNFSAGLSIYTHRVYRPALIYPRAGPIATHDTDLTFVSHIRSSADSQRDRRWARRRHWLTPQLHTCRIDVPNSMLSSINQ